MQVNSAKVEPDVIMYSALTISSMKDDKLLEEIHECKKKIILETHAGTKRIKEEVNITEYRVVYYEPESMTKLFSISDMVKKGNYVYTTTRDANCFVVVSRNIKDTIFPCDKYGLYVREYEKAIQRNYLPYLPMTKIVMMKMKIFRFMGSRINISIGLLLVRLKLTKKSEISTTI